MRPPRGTVLDPPSSPRAGRRRPGVAHAGRSRAARLVGAVSLALTLTGVGLVAGPAGPAVAEEEFRRGPAPTESLLAAPTGPFATAQVTVAASSVSGFGGGVIYHPTDTSQGTFGAVAIVPGFFSPWSVLSWLGPRLASHGFVVFGIETNSGLDFPDQRGDQLLAALDYLTTRSAVASRVDSARLAVAGHSMGGGGTLAAANKRPALQAAIPLAGWHLTKSWPGVKVPTLVIAGESDTVASPSGHSEPFYTSIPTTTEKAYLELNNAGHGFPASANTPMARMMISWLKRFVDNDTRYDQFLCPGPSVTGDIQEYRSTCPLG